MKKKNRKKEKVFCSLAEIEKDYLPNSYRKTIGEETHKKPGDFGSELAMDFLEDIRRRLIK